MLSLQVDRLAGPKALSLVEVPVPDAAGGVVIDVHAAGVSFPDLLMIKGEYQLHPEPPFAPGTEVAGVVREAPAGSAWRPGDRVSAYTSWGGYSEVIAVDAGAVGRVPPALDFVQGAAMMINYQTAYFALRIRSHLNRGETLLVHGAAGGVGIAAVQIGHALGGRVIAVVRGSEKAAFVREAGCDEVIDLEQTENWVEAVRELTDGNGAEIAFDPVGGTRFDQSLRAIRRDGKALIIGFASGEISKIPANHLLLKNVDAVGVAWGMYLKQEPQLLRDIGKELDALVEEQGLRPMVGATYALAEGAAALEQLASRQALGKSVLVVR
ncbi:MAG TPA: NADPH:quinone oxidoreductase family protein [Solirubrobacterales bacterium]|nr:NADPH:quinone oxidoreductase family protein [Solirubrobacterales bacterium]